MIKKIYVLIIVLLFVAGCSPSTPSLPRIYFTDTDKMVIKEVNINSVKLTNKPIFNKMSKIAVFSFNSPKGSQGGNLVSDVFTALLEKKGYQEIVERENIDQILSEQYLIGQSKTDLSDLEISDRIGNLLAADYMVFGAVTLYQTEAQKVYLPIQLNSEDVSEYEEEYNTYKKWYIEEKSRIQDILFFKFLPWEKVKKQREKQLRNEANILSIEELKNALAKISKFDFQVIATVGISAKIVDIKTGTVLWLGQGETNDFTLVGATKRILNKFLESIEGMNTT